VSGLPFGPFRSRPPMENPLLLPPLALAYVGDVVFELFVRTRLIERGHVKVGDLHKQAVTYVRAKGQAAALASLQASLSDQEQDVVRRGRNAKGHSTPRGSDAAEYAAATAFETLVGFLYLSGRDERLAQVLLSAANCLE
jgi:ribonuclease-3 family protein